MTDDRTAEALHRLSMRPDIARPLSSDAQARIEARLDTAFSDASIEDGLDRNQDVDDITLVPVATKSQRLFGRRRWLASVTTAAAAILLVLGLIVVHGDDPQPAAELPGPSATEFPMDLFRVGTRWRLVSDPIESEDGAARASLTLRMEAGVRAQARVETSDIPPRQFLGEVRFDVDPTGHVLVPLVLLDPERAWVDCDATIDLSGSGTAICDDDVVDYAAAAGPAEVVVTPAGRFEARLIDVDWTHNDAVGGIRTRLWISVTAGPVRVEVDDGETPRTFTLEEFQAPDDPPVTTLQGD